MNRVELATQKFYGLLELDHAGTVLYSRIEGEDAAADDAAPDVTGLNFYADVAPFRNVGDFRQQLDSFSRGAQPASTIYFTCDYADGPTSVKVLLARIRENSRRDTTKSILVHIRKVE